MRKHAPEDCARDVLAEDAGERAEDAASGRKHPHHGRQLALDLEAAKGARDWLDRYIKAIEEGSRPGLREVK